MTEIDPLLWLEEVSGERALQWVRERNAHSTGELQAMAGFTPMRSAIRAILDSRQQIPYVSRRGEHFYNLWRDAANPRGLWRRTTLAQYRLAEPAWETVLDLDALGRAEGENWVFAGVAWLAPAYRRCILSLSRGGADARVLREFDAVDKRFVADGFVLREGKSSATWINADEVYLEGDLGPGTLTESGYPRTVRRWRRGTAPEHASVVFEAQPRDVAASVSVDDTPGFERTVFERGVDFFRTESFLLETPAAGGALRRVDKPDDASLSFWREYLLLTLRSDWTVGGTHWPRGALLAIPAAAHAAEQRDFAAVFLPTATRALQGISLTRGAVVLQVLDNVSGVLEAGVPSAASAAGAPGATSTAAWTTHRLAAPSQGNLSAQALHDPLIANDPLGEALFVHYTDFLTPDSLLLANTQGSAMETLKSRPRFFDTEGMRIEQRHARSADGTRVPYFVIWPRGPVVGPRPTLLYGYGGFELPMLPSYSGGRGSQWLARGGVWVVANIRGGGEFGPAWHQAALREKRQAAFDDFIAVAEDLIASGTTSAQQLGIEGGSNGGLLVGAVMLQRPELFKAVVCQVPLLDMRRYHRLLAGASWMSEFGNPDDAEDWAFISRYSPYQVVRGAPPAGPQLPRVLFVTSTRDDRVHPSHARKMAERMRELGHDVLYWENTEGGHGGAADNEQTAQMQALQYAFLWRELAGHIPPATQQAASQAPVAP